MEERRQYVRLDTTLTIRYRVLEEPPPSTATQSLDIGGGGIRIFLKEPLKADTSIELEIFLPEERTSIRCQGKIVWVEEFSIYQPDTKIERKELEAGIEFTKISQEDRDRIVKHVILGYTPKRISNP